MTTKFRANSSSEAAIYTTAFPDVWRAIERAGWQVLEAFYNRTESRPDVIEVYVFSVRFDDFMGPHEATAKLIAVRMLTEVVEFHQTWLEFSPREWDGLRNTVMIKATVRPRARQDEVPTTIVLKATPRNIPATHAARSAPPDDDKEVI